MDWQVTMDFTGASVNRAGCHSSTDERPLSNNAQTRAVRFGIDLQAAQLVSAPGGLTTSPPDVPRDDPGTSDISEDPSTADQLMWMGVTLPLPIELRPHNTATGTDVDSPPLVPIDSNRLSRAELPHLIDGGLAPVREPRVELSADPRSVSIDPVTVDLSTLEPELRSTPETMSPANMAPSSTLNEERLSDSSLSDVRHPRDAQPPAQPTVDEEPPTFDAPVPDAENTFTVNRPTGFVPAPLNEVHTHIPHAATQSSRSPGTIPGELRTELSEVVRQVRTMVTEHETRTTIQLEPAELGRLTLELVDAPEGLRAHISAEDPTVRRFLEHNVPLLETEARMQGMGNMSFSVGADASGEPGRGHQRPSEAGASLRQNIEWNTAPHAKPRSRRELDTNA